MSYIRFSENYKINQLIPASESPYKYIKNPDSPYFISLMKYGEEEFNKFQETKSLAGISGSKTNKIWADFDSAGNLQKAFTDAKSFVRTLFEYGFKEEEIQISFSGSKGVSILIETINEYTSEQVKAFVFDIGEGLETLDPQVFDNQRIFRLNYTKNEKTGLYKIPITFEELTEANIDNIKELAKIPPTEEEIQNTLNYYKISDYKIPNEYLNVQKIEPKKLELIVDNKNIDWSAKPKFLSNCRWALQNGLFKHGLRSQPLLCLASTYKNLGYNQAITYRMLKGVAETQSLRNNEERYSDKELYNNIVLQVYSDRWNNGQFSCKAPDNFLYDYCKSLGEHSCKHDKNNELKIRKFIDLTTNFKKYVKEIDKNTILTGIPSLDKNLFISTGTNLGIIGSAGSGKTSIMLDILNNTSKAGIKTIVASLDMGNNRIYEKVMYRLSGLSREELYKIFQDDKENELLDKLNKEFGNVYFFQKSMATVQDIREYILTIQEQTEDKIKLVMIDYFERIISDMSDDTASSKRISGELQDLVNDLDIALITLVQPNKFSIQGGPEKPITNYTSIKGSSHLYQSFRQILSINRPFYTSETKEFDLYMQMFIIKNDLGELNNFVFNWNGKRGTITEMEDFQKEEFYNLLKQKESKGEDQDKSWS